MYDPTVLTQIEFEGHALEFWTHSSTSTHSLEKKTKLNKISCDVELDVIRHLKPVVVAREAVCACTAIAVRKFSTVFVFEANLFTNRTFLG